MTENITSNVALENCRVLDLTEGGFNWCGKVLADLGADVVKIEPPDGSPTRDRGPFYKDVRHRERSLFWFAYCNNKRGVTLDLESANGALRGLLIELHAHIEELASPEAGRIEASIWRELAASTERRKLSLGPY